MKINSITNKYYMNNQDAYQFFSVERNPEKNLQNTKISYVTINVEEQEKPSNLNNTTENGDEMRKGLIISASLREQFEMIRSQNINS